MRNASASAAVLPLASEKWINTKFATLGVTSNPSLPISCVSQASHLALCATDFSTCDASSMAAIPAFIAGVSDQLSKMCGFKRKFTTPYHPQANGLAERVHRELKHLLTILCARDGREHSWADYVSEFVWTMNSHPRRGRAGHSPNMLVFGRQLLHPLTASLGFSTEAHTLGLVDDDLLAKVHRMRDMRELVETSLAKSRATDRYYFDSTRKDVEYHEGELVVIRTKLAGSERSGHLRKLQAKWTGPWTVVRALPKNRYLVSRNQGTERKTLHVSKLFRLRVSPAPPSADELSDDHALAQSAPPAALSSSGTGLASSSSSSSAASVAASAPTLAPPLSSSSSSSSSAARQRSRPAPASDTDLSGEGAQESSDSGRAQRKRKVPTRFEQPAERDKPTTKPQSRRVSAAARTATPPLACIVEQHVGSRAVDQALVGRDIAVKWGVDGWCRVTVRAVHSPPRVVGDELFNVSSHVIGRRAREWLLRLEPSRYGCRGQQTGAAPQPGWQDMDPDYSWVLLKPGWETVESQALEEFSRIQEDSATAGPQDPRLRAMVGKHVFLDMGDRGLQLVKVLEWLEEDGKWKAQVHNWAPGKGVDKGLTHSIQFLPEWEHKHTHEITRKPAAGRNHMPSTRVVMLSDICTCTGPFELEVQGMVPRRVVEDVTAWWTAQPSRLAVSLVPQVMLVLARAAQG